MQVVIRGNVSLIWISSNLLQEAAIEIQQLCEKYSWLTDIHVFSCQWNPSSLESLIDHPASLYDEYVNRVRHWTERISTVPPSVSSSNQLFTVHCAGLKENLSASALKLYGHRSFSVEML